MKGTYRFLTILFGVSLMVSPAFSQGKNQLYQAKSGIIEYKLTGNTTGTETLYFDNHGAREAKYREATTKVLGMKTTEETLSLRIDSVMYEINLLENTGIKTVIPFDPSKMSEEEMKEWEELGKKMMADMGFEKIGEEKILGRNCEIWEGMSTKIWIWEGLTLKTESSIMGNWVTEATNIEVNPKISGDKFKIPDGVEIMDEGYVFDEDEMDAEEVGNAWDSVGSELGKELEKSLNDLKGILGGKKKK